MSVGHDFLAIFGDFSLHSLFLAVIIVPFNRVRPLRSLHNIVIETAFHVLEAIIAWDIAEIELDDLSWTLIA